MNFEQLQYVVMIAECGNITKAAEKLFVSQSTLTKSMNRLEYELGVKLFDRMAAPVRLTSAGEYFLEEAKGILERKENLERNLMEYMDFKKGKIHVGMGPGRCEDWLPHILSRFWKLHPHIEVQVVTGGVEFLEQELLERRLDLAFLSLSEEAPSQLECEVVNQERLLFGVPAGHPILQGRSLPADSFLEPVVLEPEDLNGQTFLTAPRTHGITVTLQQLMKTYGIVPGQMVRLTSINVAYALAAEGMGIAYVYETCAYHPGYHLEPVFCVIGGKPEMVNISAAVRSQEPVPFLVRTFIEITKEAVKGEIYQRRRALL